MSLKGREEKMRNEVGGNLTEEFKIVEDDIEKTQMDFNTKGGISHSPNRAISENSSSPKNKNNPLRYMLIFGNDNNVDS